MASIMQGTTPSVTLAIRPEDFLLSDVTGINLYVANGCKLSTYTMADLSLDMETNTVTFTFSEAETAALSVESSVVLQAQFYFADGSVVGIEKIRIRVVDMLGVGD